MGTSGSSLFGLVINACVSRSGARRLKSPPGQTFVTWFKLSSVIHIASPTTTEQNYYNEQASCTQSKDLWWRGSGLITRQHMPRITNLYVASQNHDH